MVIKRNFDGKMIAVPSLEQLKREGCSQFSCGEGEIHDRKTRGMVVETSADVLGSDKAESSIVGHDVRSHPPFGE